MNPGLRTGEPSSEPRGEPPGEPAGRRRPGLPRPLRFIGGAGFTLAGSCEVCGGWTDRRLCPPCRQQYAAPQPRCRHCALPLAGGQAVCGQCLRTPPPVQRCLCVADYGFPWDRLILRFKHHQAPELALLLGDCLAVAARHDGLPLPEAFVPVPLSDQRLAERGYDQAWQLARQLGRRLQRPARADWLQRRFDGRPQAGLSRRERLTQLRGAFGLRAGAPAQVQGRHLALVDDVLTTGATAFEAAATLLAAGVRQVDLWVVARTPAPAPD
ncbi:MAG: ComF family protein [Proteobacteria bacterium]|nr:ComF family protein [Pseudomonadota bacterium]